MTQDEELLNRAFEALDEYFITTEEGKQLVHDIVKRLAEGKIECTQIDPVTEDGWSEWQFPIHKGYLMQCCDCGLVHEVDFKVVEKIGRIKKDGSWEGEPTKKGKFRVGMKMRRYE